MQAPQYSIVTAIKDGLAFFKETAPTVLAQTFQNWEWIIVDDGSQEPIAQYVESLADPRIRLFRNSQPLRQTRSLNVAIREARADWIVRMDGDDLANPRRLELTHKALAENPKASLVFSDYEVIEEDGSTVGVVRYRFGVPSALYRYLLSRNNPIAHPTVAFRKSAPGGRVYQYDENLRNAQDYALWKRIYQEQGPLFAHVPEPLVKYRLVRQSLSVANAPEQKSELAAIRSGQTERALKSAGASPLSGASREGMYAYRVLYFRFLSENASSSPKGASSLRLLWRALRYDEVRARAIFYAMARPLRKALKRVLFGGIYF